MKNLVPISFVVLISVLSFAVGATAVLYIYTKTFTTFLAAFSAIALLVVSIVGLLEWLGILPEIKPKD